MREGEGKREGRGGKGRGKKGEMKGVGKG